MLKFKAEALIEMCRGSRRALIFICLLLAAPLAPGYASGSPSVASTSPANGEVIEAVCYDGCSRWGKFVPLRFAVQSFTGRWAQISTGALVSTSPGAPATQPFIATCSSGGWVGVRTEDFTCYVNPIEHGMSLPGGTYFWKPFIDIPADYGGGRVFGPLRSFTIGPAPQRPDPPEPSGPSTYMVMSQARSYFTSLMIDRGILARKYGCWRTSSSAYQCSVVYRKGRALFNFQARVVHIVQDGEVFWTARNVRRSRF
jgi:hypothetical protein